MVDKKRTTILVGKTVTLLGPELKVGQKAPDFSLVPPHNRVELSLTTKNISLSQSRGKVRLISVVPSLDTPVCDMQTRRFEEYARGFTDMAFYTVSMDLPFAQARYNQANDIKTMLTLSDYRDVSFGLAYGVLIEKLRLHSRAVFIIDKDDILKYIEYVPSIANPPDFEKAMTFLKKLIN
jgi:thioredoxin-dependent peroxiredoxin